MRVVGAVSFYNETEGNLLARCLAALRPLVDHLVCIDGAYTDFPLHNNSAASTDGSLDVARSRADVLIQSPASGPWSSEVLKRNVYLGCGQPGDWFLVVDADEIVEGTIDRAMLETRPDWLAQLYRTDLAGAWRQRMGDESEEALRRASIWIHRLFAWRPGIRYHGTHHAVHVGDTLIHPGQLDTEAGARFPGLRIAHHQDERSAERRAVKQTYYDRLRKNEMTFRLGYGL